MKWFVHAWARTLVQEHAKEVNKKLGKSEFRACNGWLGSFRNRRQIVISERLWINCGRLVCQNSTPCMNWSLCAVWKNSGPFQFYYRLVSLYQYFIVIAWSIKQWTLWTYQCHPTQLRYIISYQHRTLEDTVSRSQNMMADNGWCCTLHWWCTYLTCGTSLAQHNTNSSLCADIRDRSSFIHSFT